MDPSSPKTWLMGAEAFEHRMPHHDGIEALWETKWKFPCTKGVYPFHDGLYDDFAPIFESMIKNGVQDGTSASYTHAFFPAAKALEAAGNAALREGKPSSEASSLYLRAACLLRIARFPYITAYPKVNDAAKWEAWTWQKTVYMKAGKLWNEPVTEVEIPFALADKERGDWADKPIPVYLRVPQEKEAASGSSNNNKNAKSSSETAERRTRKWPAVILITGLDGYRPDNTVRCNEFLARGWAAVVVEIPGTADCPASSSDPDAAERLWDSVLAWMQRDGRFDMCRILAWGLSSGGYYAVRLAHTHAGRIRGCVAQGAGTHWFFNAKWLERIDGHEYPFQASPPLAMKHGFDTVDEYRDNAQTKFSLLENGILQKPCTRLLLINGTMDGLMPIEDSMLLFEHGSPKEARFFPGALHMGYPMANASVYPWMESVMNDE